MIERIHIENFKSIYDLDIELGKVNLFIGENGAGKSNLLEALVFVSANQSKKLDNEFLSSRGLRVTNPILMRSAFDRTNYNKSINISIWDNSEQNSFKFINENTEYSSWIEEQDNQLTQNKEFINVENELIKQANKDFIEKIEKD